MGANITIIGTLITTAVAVVSFLASQSWDVGKTIYRERKLRKALRKEIEEASPWLRRNLLTFECMIQLSCVNALSNRGPALIPILVHAAHYPDIVLKLSTEEKAMINAIYNILYRLNKSSETISELNPQCLADEDKLQHLRLLLDTDYRESHRALLLIDLHGKNVKNLKALEVALTASDPIHKLEEEIDQALLKFAAEAQLVGESAIRKRYHDGAVSPLDVAPTPPPVAGKFYFDTTGAKYRCIHVEGELVEMVQLESQIGVVTYDLHVKRPISFFRHLYELKDSEEAARLERRFLALKPRPVF